MTLAMIRKERQIRRAKRLQIIAKIEELNKAYFQTRDRKERYKIQKQMQQLREQLEDI